ncbi:hypothetical protein QU593_10035 [Rossellomorea marisflavi]|uniref:hypothetical protein n=1 Tax=Rossellomorea marisflavi TaxID=189381 RepID=UPI0025AEF337|nr:hypothetical protein [Rossellomorea marisflavi]WJV20743.1 hypothetical protein QU593_10035 [Rossellomorea marisflavi]
MNLDEVLFEEDKLKIAEAITYHPLGSYQMGEIARISSLIADTGYDVVGYLERLRMERVDGEGE